MATIKFSDFTNQAVDITNTQVVGYKVGDTSANYRYSMAQLATGLGVTSLYADDGTIGTTRIVKVTDTVTFQNLAGTSSLFSLNDNGTFTLGKGAAAGGGYTAVAIGSAASCGNNYSVAIGANSNTNSYTYSVAIGGGSVTIGGQAGVAIGGNGTSVNGGYGVAIGYRAQSSGGYSVNLGSDSRGTGATSITLNSSGGIAAPAVTSGFGVYMASHTYADFEVAGGVSKFSFDADSFSTLTVADASHTTLATGESGNLTLDAAGDVTIDADSGVITFKGALGASLATIETLRKESFIIACSDETTALTTGTKATIRIPYGFLVTAATASLTTAGTGANLVTVDINNAGVSMLSVKITIDATETTSTTALTQPVFNFPSTIATDAQVTIDIDQIDSGGVSAGLKVTLIGYQTV